MGEPQATRVSSLTKVAAPGAGSQHRRLATGTAIVLLALAVASIKPWGAGDPAIGAADGTDGVRDRLPAASSSPGPSAHAPTAVERACGRPNAWRATTIERDGDRTIRVSAAIEAVRASGPGDDDIPYRRIVASSVTALGYCAPAAGEERPPPLEPELWVERGGRFVRAATRGLGPAIEGGLGALWRPVASTRSALGDRQWPPGRYAIRLGTAGSYERWLGVHIELPHDLGAARR